MELELLPRFARGKHGEYAYRVLYRSIMTWRLEPGKSLNEQELASALGISRTPLREAMMKLKEDLLVEIFPQSANVVTLIDFDYMEQMQFLRKSVETAVLRKLGEGIPQEMIPLLDENLRLQKNLCEDKKNFPVFFELDKVFHGMLFEAMGMRWLSSYVQKGTTHVDRMSYFLARRGNTHPRKSYQEHLEIYDMLVRGDGSQAEEVLEKHLYTFRNIRLSVEDVKYFKNIPPSVLEVLERKSY